ncbi:sigma-70 family RNA polymerase sigma factor [Aporhodopirellula aestuarii]|uniref:Sigma-70 family RNA polymerase sigma factor n=1 Tax=Aporhodopirellula aestuarii TaxID=2950107 RepID=A0ABT0TYT2_9BACT|nr:sigma-70 family RNA polymerase sigma factor [Aporhodopirellula aestuarii]MCM2369754.1 sigma-70 family RNA polymerase sigma factor [Aporhodopirellula aestuarii]
MNEQADRSGSDAEVASFVQLYTTNERRIRAFLFTLLGDRDSVDEVMQNVSTVLWKKYHELDDQSGFLKWAYVIARFEVLAYRRRQARDRIVLDEDLIATLAEEYTADEQALDIEERIRYLSDCLTRLEGNDRQLLLAAYASGTPINRVAEKHSVPVNRLYKLLGRLRRKLKECVETKLMPS